MSLAQLDWCPWALWGSFERDEIQRFVGPGPPSLNAKPWLWGSPENEQRRSCCRVEPTKENGLPYHSPGITNGIKLSPQDPRPSSPTGLQMTGEKGSEKVRPLFSHTAPCRARLGWWRRHWARGQAWPAESQWMRAGVVTMERG